ncbi:MAG: butyrate kinase [Bacteroidetes bacterium HGW-Bacteroidetes-4]|jgi:butyrate kinase|nr:MAG: butyrate kinase [Bacteroidetes bacterium HGW-Bacteroidetes-4]
MINEAVIVINPGSTSTKVALYSRQGELHAQNIEHEQSELDKIPRIADQLDYRLTLIKTFLRDYLSQHSFKIVGVVGRGGIVKPLSGGTYRISPDFLDDASSGKYGEHASNLGSLLANRLKELYNLDECYTVDPVSVGNMWAKAEISGVPDIVRIGRGHPLNMKMTARKVARLQQIPFSETNYIIGHLGGGISISLVQAGKLVDINDGLLGMGPFSPNRAGSLPLRGVMKLCYSMTEPEVKTLLSKNSGFKAYLGTEDLRDVIKMMAQGDKKAQLIFDAFVYQVAKEIGAYYVASKCEAQAIIITGGIAHNKQFIDELKSYVGKLTAFYVFPGENEMEALAEGVFRVIDGEEEAQEY